MYIGPRFTCISVTRHALVTLLSGMSWGHIEVMGNGGRGSCGEKGRYEKRTSKGRIGRGSPKFKNK
jgi:predicted NBD/HSP70 family sugar kinase